MQVTGVQKCSLVDWPGKISVALFTPGCNLDCFFCHNRGLLNPSRNTPVIEQTSLFDWLSRRKGFLDGVVITGGEPTLQPDLPLFIERVRQLGYPVKLDTNGTRPAVLASLLNAELLDYVAMDVKGPRQKYNEICGVPVDEGAIDASIRHLRRGTVDYEFRTTCVPQLTADDLVAVALRVSGARRFVLQQYRPLAMEDLPPDVRLEAQPHSAEWFARVLARIGGIVEGCETRGVEELAFASTRVA